MLSRSNGKSGTREYTALLLLTVGLKLSDTTPSILFKSGKIAAWVIPLLAFGVMVVPFLLLLAMLKSRPEKGLTDLLFLAAGRWGGMLIGLALCLVTLVSTAFGSRTYVDIINTMGYQRTPLFALYLMLMAAVFYVANRGFETIGRTAWIVVPYIEVFLALLVVFVWYDVEWQHLFPAAGPGLPILLREGANHGSIFGEMILFTAFIPLMRNLQEFKIASWIGFGACAVKIAGMTAVYIAVYDFPPAENMAYPFQQLTRAASIGQIISHLESVFFAFWLITTVVHFAVYVYLLAFLFARSLGLDTFEPLILPFTGLTMLIGMVPENSSRVNQVLDTTLHVSTYMFILLPFVLWSMIRLRRLVH
ncbi:GerAB/ArcD/ProY family transporter [Paenibacillus methanolicus]|uniref:Spore germination protein (Amino acid permease) n=1 Tax=Paenibacillus methanolicus TaxID=582686 RepID=A0A5S5C6J9_9BACL|nr:GerAB/ArcD/ProY family transporter [Paenibacillus methanolicus]TYP74789.1 spore germination protein (amino acid permease) [Paenibacillus methanolicus]